MARVRHFKDCGRYGGNGVALDGIHGGLLGFFPIFSSPFFFSNDICRRRRRLRRGQPPSTTGSARSVSTSLRVLHVMFQLLRAFCFSFSSAHVLLSTAAPKLLLLKHKLHKKVTMSGEGESNTQSNTQPLTGTSSNSIHSKRTDVAWKHCTAMVRSRSRMKAFKKAIQDIEALNEEGCMEIGSSGDFSLKDTRKGPIDLYTQPQSTVAKNRKAKVVQTGVRELCDKKLQKGCTNL
ncbi:hypothetical protein SESBI_48685 [Sesbania bispinosa]|nr:hypothetical protein SESBI_48685 [Sesbania bispinosa]